MIYVKFPHFVLPNTNRALFVGLRHLIHLRELDAEDNCIVSIDDIMHLDGMTRLNLRRNKVTRVDFEKSYMYVFLRKYINFVRLKL